MAREKKILIHIGMHKTGTTALQGFFVNHADRFIKNRIVYPVSGRRSNQHFFLASSGDNYQDLFLKSWKDLYTEVSAHKWNTIVISSERFFLNQDPEIIKRICDQFCADVHIILFLRNHIDALMSIYRTAIKSLPRVCCTAHVFTDYFINKNSLIKRERESNILNYNSVIERWERSFSNQNVHVISYDNIIESSNTIESFLVTMEKLGIKVPNFEDKELSFRSHQTQPDLILDLLLRTNQFVYNEIPYWKFIRHLFDIGADANFTTHSMQFSLNDAKKIISTYGQWSDESSHIEKFLVSSKMIISEDERKNRQLEILKSIDNEWDKILNEVTLINKEEIVNLPIIDNSLIHYKLLYERDYRTLRFKLDREAYHMNQEKRYNSLNDTTSERVTNKDLVSRLKKIFFRS